MLLTPSPCHKLSHLLGPPPLPRAWRTLWTAPNILHRRRLWRDSPGARPNIWETPMHLSVFTAFSLQKLVLLFQYFRQVYASELIHCLMLNFLLWRMYSDRRCHQQRRQSGSKSEGWGRESGRSNFRFQSKNFRFSWRNVQFSRQKFWRLF